MSSWFILVPSAALGIYCAKELWIDALQLLKKANRAGNLANRAAHVESGRLGNWLHFNDYAVE
jgi:hypothetical protein